MKPPWRYNHLKWEQNEKGENVQRRLIRKDCICFNSFKCENSASELNLSCRIGNNGRKGGAEHGDEDGEEERISQKGESYHEDGAKEPVKVH